MSLKFYKDELGKLAVKAKDKTEAVVGKPAEKFLRLAITLPNIKRPVTEKIKQVLTDRNYRYAIKPNFPLSVPCKGDADKVRVFSNIKASFKAEDVLEYIISVLKDKRTEVKFATPERAIKMALKSEITTFAKLVYDYTNLRDLGKQDDEIRDVAKALAMAFKPVQVIICKTPRDYYIMYSTKVPGSCMAKGTTYYGDWTSKSWVKIADDTGVYPSAWYHYQPYAKGCYLVVDGEPVARWMIYRDDITKDEWPYYGDIKGISAAFRSQVEALMKKEGKKQKSYVKTTHEYRVPALYHELLGDGKVPHCPLPNCDNQTKDFSVAYDAATDEFVFGLKTDHPDWTSINSTYDHRGYIKGNAVKKINVVDAKEVKKEAPKPAPVEEVVAVVKPKRVRKPAAPKVKEVVEVLPEVKPKAKRVSRKVVEEVDVVKPIATKKPVATKVDNLSDGYDSWLVTIE